MPNLDEALDAAFKVRRTVELELEKLMQSSDLATAAVLMVEIKLDNGEDVPGLQRASLRALRPRLVGAIAEDADRVLSQSSETSRSRRRPGGPNSFRLSTAARSCRNGRRLRMRSGASRSAPICRRAEPLLRRCSRKPWRTYRQLAFPQAAGRLASQRGSPARRPAHDPTLLQAASIGCPTVAQRTFENNPIDPLPLKT